MTTTVCPLDERDVLDALDVLGSKRVARASTAPRLEESSCVTGWHNCFLACAVGPAGELESRAQVVEDLEGAEYVNRFTLALRLLRLPRHLGKKLVFLYDHSPKELRRLVDQWWAQQHGLPTCKLLPAPRAEVTS